MERNKRSYDESGKINSFVTDNKYITTDFFKFLLINLRFILCLHFREPTYTIVYREEKENGREIEEKEGFEISSLNYFASRTISPSPSSLCQPACTVEEVVNLLRHLYSLSPQANKIADDALMPHLDQTKGYYIPLDEFVSKKITNKLGQQVQDPLVLASRALPSWCEDLTYSAPMLFPFETRHLYFNCTAYGTSR